MVSGKMLEMKNSNFSRVSDCGDERGGYYMLSEEANVLRELRHVGLRELRHVCQ